MKTIADKIAALGGELASPATFAEVDAVEVRLGVTLPQELREFLLEHNGSSKETDEGIWRFWPCSEITSYKIYRDEDIFSPASGDLRRIDPAVKEVKLAGSNLILFADALFDLPIYGVFLSPGHPLHGMVFNASDGWLSALGIGHWISAFIERAEDCLLLPETAEPELQ